MDDIIITKRRNRAYIVGVTDRGKNHLFSNFETKSTPVLDVSIDLIDELEEQLKAAGLSVESK